MLEKYLSWSPYCYSIGNPIVLVDIGGNDVRFSQNEQERQTQLTLLTLTLPAEYNDFVRINDNNSLDVNRLREAQNESNMPASTDYDRLLTIAESNEIVQLDIVESGDVVSSTTTSTNEIHNITFGPIEGTKNSWVGQTIVSGNIDNTPQQPDVISRSGNTEVIVMSTGNNVFDAVTLAHELYGHTFNYISGNNWHENSIENELTEIENRAKENAENR